MGLDDTVLTFKRQELPPCWCGERCFLKIDLANFKSSINALTPVFMKRRLVEHDSAYKQPIPYVVFVDNHNKFACFPRHSSEERLHGLWSVGIGGHVDEADNDIDVYSTILNGVYRELFEETDGFIPDKMSLRFIGVINEELTSVGHTHFGCVFVVQLTDKEIVYPAEELKGMVWMKRSQLLNMQLELWSDIVLELLDS